MLDKRIQKVGWPWNSWITPRWNRPNSSRCSRGSAPGSWGRRACDESASAVRSAKLISYTTLRPAGKDFNARETSASIWNGAVEGGPCRGTPGSVGAGISSRDHQTINAHPSGRPSLNCATTSIRRRRCGTPDERAKAGKPAGADDQRSWWCSVVRSASRSRSSLTRSNC